MSDVTVYQVGRPHHVTGMWPNGPVSMVLASDYDAALAASAALVSGLREELAEAQTTAGQFIAAEYKLRAENDALRAEVNRLKSEIDFLDAALARTGEKP